MAVRAARFTALLLVALALAPSLAHLLELPNKIGLPREAYFTVQQIYRGWALLGTVVFGALAATLALAILERGRRGAFALSLAAFLALAAAQAVFWTLTEPANRATADWTALPPDWAAVRDRWEYSHAAAAVLNLAALVLLILSVTAARRDEPPPRAADGAEDRGVRAPAGSGQDDGRLGAAVWPRPLPVRPATRSHDGPGESSPRRARMRASSPSRTER